jgi:hypothetical protein
MQKFVVVLAALFLVAVTALAVGQATPGSPATPAAPALSLDNGQTYNPSTGQGTPSKKAGDLLHRERW